MTKSYSSLAPVLGLLPPARRLPEAIKTLPSPNSPWLLSMSKTLAPCSDPRTAAVKPAKPAPTTKTSHEMLFITSSSFTSERYNFRRLERFEPLERIERLSSSKAIARESCSPAPWRLPSPDGHQLLH